MNKYNQTLDKNFRDKEKLIQIPTRNGYGEGLVLAGKENPNVLVLCADLTESTRSIDFQKEFPKRFIECGIAEQNMMSMASGLALSGKIPFVSTYAVFSPGMNWGQIRVNVLQNNANVKIAGAHTGISVGPDGMSHQALEDIAILRCLPGIIILVPCDAIEARKAVLAAARCKGAVYLRFAREKTPVFTSEKTPFQIGKAEILKKGKDVTIIGCGPLLYEALLAAEKLEKKGIEAEVINNHTIKPLDEKTILASIKKTKVLVTIEEHQIMGGMGSAVVEMLAKKFPAPVEMIGVQDRFGESGEPEELMEKFKLTHPYIIKAVEKVLKRK
ncbi:MAG: transketolase C-terminal domain-containing protein [Patescibacteria group bacterium]